MGGEAGLAGVVGGTGGGFTHRAALLHAGGHLTHRVASDTHTSSRRRVHVVLHDGGQHGDVVALGAYHRVLDDRGGAWFGGPGVLQPLFYRDE